jgi:hypothetical protein
MDLAQLPAEQLVAIVIATSFAAGLNVYATGLTLGVLSHAGLLALPDPLALLANWWVIGGLSALFVVEFVADKIPAFDLVWNALQTVVRVPAGALLAYGATVQLTPGQQMLAAAIGGTLALAAHAGKTAARAAVNASPEPFSNAALSLGEDAAAIGLTWFATSHPYMAAAIVLTALVVIVLLIRFVIRAFRSMRRRAAGGQAPQGGVGAGFSRP